MEIAREVGEEGAAVQKLNLLNKSMTQKWNFQKGGGGGSISKTFCGRVWIHVFSGATQFLLCHSLVCEGGMDMFCQNIIRWLCFEP